MQIDSLILETTRRCNLSCPHCLRGNPEEKDMPKETVEKFLKDNKIDFINAVTFTGGEPTLSGQVLPDFIDTCKKLGVTVGNFYVVLNGKQIPDEFIKSCVDLYLFCTDNEISAVEVSRSAFYTGQQDEQAIKKMKLLRFAGEKNALKPEWIKSEGRGKTLVEDYGLKPNPVRLDHLKMEDDTLSGECYLNVNGDICSSCDLSYKNQRRLRLGNIHKMTLEQMLQKQTEKTKEKTVPKSTENSFEM
jgi:sulfatase maturation enzyme AslB (radical SAM superfamily)